MAYSTPLASNQPTMSSADAAPTKLNPAANSIRSGLRGSNPTLLADGTTANTQILLVKLVTRGTTPPTKAQMLSGRVNYSVQPGGSWDDSGRITDAYGMYSGTAGSATPLCEEYRD